MSEHTREPWSYRKTNHEGHASGAFYIYGKTKDYRSTTVAHIKQSTIQPMEANARRIVACVNACAGIDTKYLESPDNLATYARKMAEQRDELLASVTAQRDTAWAEANEIREAIQANPEESTADEVRRVVSQRDELLTELKSAIEHIDFKHEAYTSAYELITKIEARK